MYFLGGLPLFEEDGKIKRRRRPRESGDIGAKSLCWAGWNVPRREDWQKVIQHVDPVGETANGSGEMVMHI